MAHEADKAAKKPSTSSEERLSNMGVPMTGLEVTSAVLKTIKTVSEVMNPATWGALGIDAMSRGLTGKSLAEHGQSSSGSTPEKPTSHQSELTDALPSPSL